MRTRRRPAPILRTRGELPLRGSNLKLILSREFKPFANLEFFINVTRRAIATMVVTGPLPERTPVHEPLTEHTLRLRSGVKSPSASITDVEWLAGHWKGEAFGGVSEEIWSAPGGGVMMGMYRLVRDGKPVFYELMMLAEENGSLVLRLKHFNSDLTGWEEKEKTVDFPFVAKADGVMHFEGMTYRPEGHNAVTVFLAIRQKDGSVREEKFYYERVPLVN